MTVNTEFKTCSKCGESKPLSGFYRAKRYKNGIRSWCIACVKNNCVEMSLKPKVFVESKKCSCCGEVKNSSEFNSDKRSKDGLRSDCRDCYASRHAKSYNKNKTTVKDKVKSYQAKNPEKVLGWKKKYKDNNRGKINANTAARKSSQKSATPEWLSDEHKEQIEFMYWFADQIKGLHGKNYHVDHIHPVRGKNFVGLHVPWNLQILPAKENIGKGNRLPKGEEHLFF